ncbi:MAG TPA: hypothetical protein VK000_00200 [Luteimonas sp.]|nr:hypothetical protein [Luteimonas sp.]
MRRIDRMGIAVLLGAGLLPCAAAPCQTVSLDRGGEQLVIAVGDAARLPDAFPEDVHVPAAARLLRVEQAADGRLLVQFALARDPAAIADEYEAAMTVAGWTRARVAPFPDARVQAWERGERAVVVAVRAAADGGARLQLDLRPRMARRAP